MTKFLFGMCFILFLGGAVSGGILNQNSVDYKIAFQPGSSQNLSQSAGEDGFSPSEFSGWLSSSARISKSIDGSGFDKPSESQLMLFAVDQRGAVISQTSLSMRVTTNSVPLGNRLNVNNLGRSLEALFVNQECTISGDVLLSEDILFPGGFIIGNLYESQRLAGNAARRAIQNSTTNSKGYTLFLMLAPDIDEFDY